MRQDRHYTFNNGNHRGIDNIAIYGTGEFCCPGPADIIIGSVDVSENGAWREATDEELIEINEDEAFLSELCSGVDLRSSVTKFLF